MKCPGWKFPGARRGGLPIMIGCALGVATAFPSGAAGQEGQAVARFSPRLLQGIEGRYLKTHSGDIYLFPDRLPREIDRGASSGKAFGHYPPPPGFFSRRFRDGWRMRRPAGCRGFDSYADCWRYGRPVASYPKWMRGRGRYPARDFSFWRYPRNYPNY